MTSDASAELYPGQWAPQGQAIRMQEMFLPVHGYVRLFPEEVAIINHPAFQRLRRCRQLGFAHFLFPGAVHTRFEHSIGAAHVAGKMIRYVNANCASHAPDGISDLNFEICSIGDEVARLIRLGALLHDVGHIPLGHTLEDELEHLEKHDGEARIERIAAAKSTTYHVDPGLRLGLVEPEGGWDLATLVNAAYRSAAHRATNGALESFEILKLITLKPPQEGVARAAWEVRRAELCRSFPLEVSRDIIGNTICADFIDYLFRDWYHLGKPMQEDRRLYQYMEVRVPKKNKFGASESQQFVINVGPEHKLRHDAITNIFELLEARYKLSETVLFHRTKLALTALLDRCFMELRYLYQRVGLKGAHQTPEQHLSEVALALLLESSDDDLDDIIVRLADGADELDRRTMQEMAKRFDESTLSGIAVAPAKSQPELMLSQPANDERGLPFNVAQQQDLIRCLAQRLANRNVYTQACKVPIRQFEYHGRPGLENADIPEKLVPLREPGERHKHLIMLERKFGLPPGSVVMYLPPKAAMNAKIADVKLLISGHVMGFRQYEQKKGDASLSGGALHAQISRFFQLWGVSLYVERTEWHKLSPDKSKDVERAFRHTLYLTNDELGRVTEVVRDFEKTANDTRRSVAYRERSEAGASAPEFADEEFVSGLPFGGGLTKSSASAD